MALKNVKRSLDRIFDKNLQDLVRGIRSHKDTEVSLIVNFQLKMGIFLMIFTTLAKTVIIIHCQI